MSTGSLAPAFVVVDYHSAFGTHKMTIPVNAPIDPNQAIDTIECLDWDSDPQNLETKITDLITELLPRFDTSCTFDTYTLFTKADEESPPLYVGTGTLDLDGTNGTAGWNKATQETILMRGTGGSLLKLVLLDFASGDDFANYRSATAAGLAAVFAEYNSVSSIFRTRKGEKVSSFIQRTAKLNDALRKQYHMS